MNELVHKILAGSAPPAMLGRLISVMERGGAPAMKLERAVFPHAGRAYVIGITGAPGVGKSTLTGQLIRELCKREMRVAVLAIDPSSPFSGGAILGDRVRMVEHSLECGVFIRSIATRGCLGGLAAATPSATRLLDAAGFDVVLLETVGVGQAELDVARLADSVVVVMNPGWGDDVQAAKAGLMEIADVFAINKSDRPGAEEAARDLRLMLRTRPRGDGKWTPPIILSIATEGVGTPEVANAVWSHLAWLEEGDRLKDDRAARLWLEVETLVAVQASALARERVGKREIDKLQRRLVARELDPWMVAKHLLEHPRICEADGMYHDRQPV